MVPGECLSDAFTSTNCTLHLEQFAQVSRFAGVGAHHHDAVAETVHPNGNVDHQHHDVACCHTLE